ncbi:hypothetical protein IJ707_03965, partial [bacterium]|nr:hypothetical protein [bacterium]
NLAIHGGIEAEYGITKINDANLTSDPKGIILTARGGVVFKSNSFDANVSANISTRKAKFSIDDNDISMRATSASLIGNVSTKDFDFSTTISAINAPADDDSGDRVFEIKNKTSVTTSIMIGIKKLFGKNVMPILRYNVGNYDGANQNFNVGVILTP